MILRGLKPVNFSYEIWWKTKLLIKLWPIYTFFLVKMFCNIIDIHENTPKRIVEILTEN